ncbi:MAG: T9SS type A sorting domain-containing protein, partial [Bacteroidales bacterium]|nr:T9SS type A sorting domain-containing protein [Bacteroidales bacterium]
LSIDDFTVDILPQINQIDINNNVANVSVCQGEAEATAIAALAPQITITDSDNAEHVVGLTWTIASYDATIPADYIATGVFELPVGVIQTDPLTSLEVTATVTVHALPEVACPADFTVTESNVVALSGATPAGGTYSGVGVAEGAFDPSSLDNGSYTVVYDYTDATTGCSNSCEFVITVDIVSSIDENEMTSIGVYPNPNNGMFNINFNNINGKVVYQIYDTKGSVIAAKNIYTDGNTIEEVSLNLIPGVYFVKVVTTNQSYVEKLVIE